MPRTGISRRLSEAVQAHGKGVTIGDVMALAHLYNVSAEAMFQRLEELRRIPVGKWDELQKRGFHPDQARAVLGFGNDNAQPSLPLRYRLLAKNAFERKGLLTEGQLARKLRMDRVSARLELESLRKLVDGLENEQYVPFEFDHTELLQSKSG